MKATTVAALFSGAAILALLGGLSRATPQGAEPSKARISFESGSYALGPITVKDSDGTVMLELKTGGYVDLRR